MRISSSNLSNLYMFSYVCQRGSALTISASVRLSTSRSDSGTSRTVTAALKDSRAAWSDSLFIITRCLRCVRSSSIWAEVKEEKGALEAFELAGEALDVFEVRQRVEQPT